MKSKPLTAVLAVLAVESGLCFVPSKLQPYTAPRWSSRNNVSLFSSNMDGSPLDSAKVLSAYDEWREKFGKGADDPVRFSNFESNYKVLTSANIQARNRAMAEGNAPPQWLELNEFGDMSREEFEAMKKGLQEQVALVGTRPIRSTQVIKPTKTSGTQVLLRADPGAKSQVRGTQVISKAEENQAPQMPSTSSWGTEKFTSDQRMNNVQGTQVIQKSSQQSSPAEKPSVTPAASYLDSLGATQPRQGTQVLKKAEDQSPATGTQVVRPASYQSPPSISGPVRGTQVIQRNDSGDAEIGSTDESDVANRGTFVVRPGEQSPRGTVVIPRSQGAPSYYSGRGTQVISKGDQTEGSYAEKPTNGAPTGPWDPMSGRGTQVIQKANPEGSVWSSSWDPMSGRGTQVIQKANPESSVSSSPWDPTSGRGTQVIQKANPESSVSSGPWDPMSGRGTQIIKKANSESSFPSGPWDPMSGRGTQVIQKATPESNFSSSPWDPMSGRGTQVIQKAASGGGGGGNPLSDFFGENGRGKKAMQQAGEQASSSIFSLFGGSKMEENLPRSVRGNVVVEGGKTSDGKKETVLVDKADLQSIFPSIFSFFGSTKKDDMAAAKDEKQSMAPESAKRNPPRRPTLVINKNSIDFPRGRDLPEVRRWWQNADGSLTGYIYNSKNFNDGTKLTTSPLQRAATKSGNVVRSNGEEYLLA